MDRTNLTNLLACIRRVVCGEEDGQIPDTAEAFSRMYRLAKRLDLAHLMAADPALLAIPAPDGLRQALQKEQFLAVCRLERLQHMCTIACRQLEKANIAYLPLKGTVLRQIYPEPWMRTSCDVDILVRESDLEAAVLALTESGYFRDPARGSHDVVLCSADDLHLELHYCLLEPRCVTPEASAILNAVWDYAHPAESGSTRFVLSDEMFYFFHLQHMSKHFQLGGCGIRPFLDLWMLNHRADGDRNTRDALLQKGGIKKFADTAALVSEVWFSGAKPSELTCRMEVFLLNGGIYGSRRNRVLTGQAKRGKLGYFLSRIFIPYRTLKFSYPILQKHPCLTPFCEVHRWFRLLFSKRRKVILTELKYSKTVGEKAAADTKDLLKELGLDDRT